MMSLLMLCSLTFLLASVWEVSGHGRFIEPPSRASMWRFGFKTPKNYQDNELFCGGFTHQQNVNQGKCGVCGDAWDASPRPHEGGPQTTYAKGVIARTYTQGDIIDAAVDVTANHKGWFEFRMCVHNDVTTAITHDCLDEHPLVVKSMENVTVDSTRVEIVTTPGVIHFKLALPSNVVCSQCVIQWKYHAGNSWGVDESGQGCVGCGAQEEFYGCSDVAIVPSGGNSGDGDASGDDGSNDAGGSQGDGNQDDGNQGSDSQGDSNQDDGNHGDDNQGGQGNQGGSDQAEEDTASDNNDNANEDDNQDSNNGGGRVCKAANEWTGQVTMDAWCKVNCAAGYCPKSHCVCVEAHDDGNHGNGNQGDQGNSGNGNWGDQSNSDNGNWGDQESHGDGNQDDGNQGDGNQGDQGNQDGSVRACRGRGPWVMITEMEAWCSDKCSQGPCPSYMCACDDDAVMEPAYVEDPFELCRAVVPLIGNPEADRWCRTNCRKGYCPLEYCRC